MVSCPCPRHRCSASKREHGFLRGKDFLGKKDYEHALAEFRASHDIVASPNTRLEIARCLRAMGKVVEAYAELGRTTVESKEMVAQDNRYRRRWKRRRPSRRRSNRSSGS